MTHPPHERAATARYPSIGFIAGQSGEARIFLIQDDNLTAEVPLRRSILQSTLRQKYRSTGRHNPQRDGGPEKGLYRLHPIALASRIIVASRWPWRPSRWAAVISRSISAGVRCSRLRRAAFGCFGGGVIARLSRKRWLGRRLPRAFSPVSA